MKNFGTFDTTNTLYGSFYRRRQDPITDIPKFSKPNMEEEFYKTTTNMGMTYFNRYKHLYKDPTGKAIYNPMDSKAFQESNNHQRKQLEINNNYEMPIRKPKAFAREFPERPVQMCQTQPCVEDAPILRTFHRTYEAQN